MQAGVPGLEAVTQGGPAALGSPGGMPRPRESWEAGGCDERPVAVTLVALIGSTDPTSAHRLTVGAELKGNDHSSEPMVFDSVCLRVRDKWLPG